MKDESEIEFLLSSPIQIAKGGVMEDCQCLTLVAPSKKLLKKSYVLQQYLTRAMMEAQQLASKMSDGQESEDSEFKESHVMQVLLASSVDMEDCFNRMDSMALAGAVKVNDKTITPTQWESIGDNDKEALVAKYLANFIMSLVMKHLSAT